MHDTGWVFVVVGMAIVIGGMIDAFRRDPDPRSRSRFAWIDVFSGRSLSGVVASVGPPARETALDDGGRVLVWERTGCEIALTFDGCGICRAVRVAEPSGHGGRPRRVRRRRRGNAETGTPAFST
jgi:hypothetical protein